MTLSIVLIGSVILLVFIIVPLQEFRHILTRLRDKPLPRELRPRDAHANDVRATDAASPAPRASDVDDRPEDRRA